MSNKTLIMLIGIAVALMLALFVLNYVQVFEPKITEQYIEIDDIKGMEVYHKNVPYTLNLKQQVKTASFLNEATAFQPFADTESRTPTSIEMIVIYRFGNLPPIEITPVYYHRDNLVFSAPQWQENGLLMENSEGKLKNLLSQTFDR